MHELKGIVFDQKHQPKGDINVFISASPEAHDDIAQVTSEDGRFNLGKFGAGEYTIELVDESGRRESCTLTLPMMNELEITI